MKKRKTGLVDGLFIALDPVFFKQTAESLGVNPDRVELVGQQGRIDPALHHIGMALRDGLRSGRAGDAMYGESLDLGLHLTRLLLDAGLPWPMIKAELPVGGEPGSFVFRWVTETLRSLLPRIEEFGLASADELDLDTLVTRMEAEAGTLRTQLIGPLQFGAWTRNP